MATLLELPFCNKDPGKNLCLQCGPWGSRPARAAQFRWGRRGSWPGKGRGRVLGGLGAGFRARLGWGGGQQGRRRRPGLVAAAACLAGEVGRCGGWRARWRFRVGARKGARGVTWPCESAWGGGRRPRRARRAARQARAGEGVGLV
jgi:hypothetical protein